jgi:hypothetical protein
MWVTKCGTIVLVGPNPDPLILAKLLFAVWQG